MNVLNTKLLILKSFILQQAIRNFLCNDKNFIEKIFNNYRINKNIIMNTIMKLMYKKNHFYYDN